ncbi:MAG: hypothetical protein Q3980_17495 [Turicibacter sp.]|nr:hypothetical protein [Turicibacter sp.]
MVKEYTVDLIATILLLIYGTTRLTLKYKLENKKLNVHRMIARPSENAK